MPLYEYRCDTCHGLEAVFRSVANRHKSPQCSVCGGGTQKIISGYHVIGDLNPYYDDNLQTHVASKQHRKKVMKEQGVSEKYGKGWYTSARR